MSLARYFDYPTETADHLSNVSLRYRYYYFANPKVASTGILRTLQMAEVDGTGVQAGDAPHDRAASPLKTVLNAGIDPDRILGTGDFFRFTYVRNPFTRILSAYLDKIVAEPWERERLLPTLGLPGHAPVSFLEFLQAIDRQRDGWRDIHWSTQTRLLQCNNIGYGYIGRFENFRSSFPALLQRLGIDARFAETMGTASHATAAASRMVEFMGPSETSLVIKIYESDFVAFKYGFDPGMAHV